MFKTFLTPCIVGGLLLSGTAQLAAATIDKDDLEQKARQSGTPIGELISEYGHLLEADTRVLPTGETELYQYYKDSGQEAPRWLQARLFPEAGRTERDGSRDGGDGPDAAVEIPFTAGAEWTDAGTTVGFTNDVPVGQTAPLNCATSFYPSSSFGGPDAWYRFTLDEPYEVAASVCDNATYDSCIGIFDINLNLVAVNEDGAGCSNWTSELPPCCLPAGTYYLVLDAYATNSGDYDLTVTFGAEPCQSPCEDYVETVTEATIPGLITGTTVDGADIIGSEWGEIGFDLTLDAGGVYNFDACHADTDVNVALYVMTASPCDAGTILAQSTGITCSEGLATSPGMISNLVLEAGEYHLVVSSPAAGEGDFAVNVFSPCDEYPTIATVTMPSLLVGDTFDGVDVYWGAAPDVGYDVEITEAGLYDFDACQDGTDFSVTLALFDSNPCDGGALIAQQGYTTCQAFAGAARLMEQYLEPGTYHLLVGDDFTTVGNYEIQIQATPGRPTAGGPDEMGYAWINSLDPEGPEYAWVDISTNENAVLVSLGDDQGLGPFPMEMDFPFYDGVYGDVYISSNGHINFLAASGSLSNQNFPNPSTPNATIALFWDDLDPGDGVGEVHYLADTDNERFIVQFTGVPDYPGQSGAPNTFQGIFGADGSILIQLNDIQGDRTSATIGVENADGTVGLLYNYNNEGGLIGNEIAITIGALEGDFLAPVIAFDNIPATVEAELPGDHMVSATITDETGVASATLFYQINNGTTQEVAMTNTEGDSWEGGIPHQEMGTLVNWWVEAVDATERENTRVTQTYTFEVVSYTWPPLALNATDGLLDFCQVTWLAPMEPALALQWFGGDMPADEDEAIERLMSEHGLDKLAAHQRWQELLTESATYRSFLNYNVYRDESLIGTTTDLVYYDLPGGGADPNVEYTYHVTAQFDAGESDASNTDLGSRGSRPTSGGPDEMGYTWINSHDPEGPAFEWTSIADTGVNLGIVGDDTSGQITLPWPFPFYDFDYTAALVSSNGYLTFGTDGTDYSNDAIMDPMEPNDAIFPFWDDLYTSSGGTIYFLDDSEVNERVIIEWNLVPHLANPATVNTFQAHLYSNGTIEFHYEDMYEGELGGQTVGIENSDASIGLQVHLNGEGGAIVDNMMVLITPIEGDFRGPFVEFTQIPQSMETELPGDHLIEATITDDSGVASATLHYIINGGAEQTSDMTNTEGDLFEGGIAHQEAGTMVSWWVTAVDASENSNERITDTYMFEVVSYTWPPFGFSATDGLLSQTNISWNAPINPNLLAEWFGDVIPTDSDEAIERLMIEQGLSKAQAIERWNSVAIPGGRPFIEYNLYRDGELLATTTDLFFVDNADTGSESDVVYDYHVTAQFDAGESDDSNIDAGYWGSPPTWGGPDAFGYAWINSENPGGPEFDWFDISGLGNALTLSDDSFDGPIDIGFEFVHYENFYNDLYVSSNGYITFGQGYSSLSNGPIPTPGNDWSPDDMIAMFWDDLNPNSGGTVYTYQDTDNQRMIVQFDAISAWGTGGPFSFQARLYSSGIIEIMYLEMDPNDIIGATIGIENSDGTIGLQYNYNGEGGLIADELAIVFTPPSSCEPVDCTGIDELEPNEGWADGTYNTFRCDDIICGSLISEGETTDSDWFLYTHFGGNIEVALETSDFDARLTLREFAPDGAIVADADVFPRCFNEAFNVTELESGSYYIVVEHVGEPDLVEAQTYTLSMTCSGDPCAGHEPISCDGTAEVEPNEGWNADPPNDSYGEILLDQPVCGTVWAADGVRDMDWFRLELETTMNLVIDCQIDAFNAALFLTDFDPGGNILHDVDEAPACHPETLALELVPAGVYYVVIGHNDLYGVPEEQPYALTVSGNLPSEDMCENYMDMGNLVDIFTMNEPAPEFAHHSGTGCPGDVYSPGLDRVIRVVLAEPMDLFVSMTGEGDADEVILLVGDCANPAISCGAAADEFGAGPEGEVLEFTNLPAGDYFLVGDFAGYGETHPFVMQIADANSGVLEGRELSFQLKPNYPNPFNPVTKILWVQPKLAEARLTVYNLMGEKVLSEALGVRGPGQHSFAWDASELSSGVYVYTLQAGDFSATRKAVLLK